MKHKKCGGELFYWAAEIRYNKFPIEIVNSQAYPLIDSESLDNTDGDIDDFNPDFVCCDLCGRECSPLDIERFVD